MKKRFIGVGMVLVTTACQPTSTGSSGPPVPPVPSVQLVSSEQSGPFQLPMSYFIGTWLLGTDAEPTEPVVRSCTSNERFFITLEKTCQVQLLAEAAGKPLEIPGEDAAKVRDVTGTNYAGWFSGKPLFELMEQREGVSFDWDSRGTDTLKK